jgi:tRNA G37 N-methylase TrmD
LSKKSRLPQSPRHVLIYNEDWEYLETRFGPTGLKPVGVSNVIRALIHQKILDWREAENIAATAARRENIQRESMKEQPNGNPTNINRPDRSTA